MSASGSRREAGRRAGRSLSSSVAAKKQVVRLPGIQLVCETPPLDAGHVVGEEFLVLGWAHSEAGIESLELTVNDGRQIPLARDRYRLDIAEALGASDAALGFGAHVDVQRLGDPPYLLTIAARTGDGRIGRLTGRVDYRPGGAYRAWLDRDEPHREERDEAREGRFLGRALGREVSADGRDLAPELRLLAGRGEGYLLLVEPGGELRPGARRSVELAFRAREAPDAVYGDEDSIGEGGRCDPLLKPGWSPELLLRTDYVGGVLAVGPRAAAAALQAGEEPITGIYELALRLVDAPLRVVRVPEVLFSRVPAGPRGSGPAATPGAGWEAIEAVARRRGIPCRIRDGDAEGTREVRWELKERPLVSVIVPSAFAGERLAGCLASLRERSTYGHVETIVVDSSDGRIEAHPGLLDEAKRVPYEPPPRQGANVEAGQFNFSHACNIGAAAASGERLVFLNDDTEILSEDWLERMLELAQLDGVGIVGAKLLYPDGTVQHGGVNVDVGASAAAHLFALHPAESAGYANLLRLPRELSAVTGACLMIDRALFAELGGFDRSFALELGDIDLCLRARAAGNRVLFAPDAQLIHHELATRGHHLYASADDVTRFRLRWRELYADGDPYYHPAFTTYPSYEFRTSPSRAPGGFEAVEPVRAASRRDSPERFVPEGEGHGRLVEAEHEARYRWAAGLAAGRETLDAGCGAGYGTAILAAAGAARVIGVDVSPEAISAARARAGEGTRFELADLRAIPFPDASFDLATCFEAIEHVPDPEAVLDELRRVLRPGGVLAISTPNRGVYLPGNPWHVHEYTPEELRRSLLLRFSQVRLYRQQSRLGTEILDDEAFSVGRPERPLAGAVRHVAAGVPGQEVYTLALASDEDLPQPPPEVVLADSYDLTAILHERNKWRTRAKDLERSMGYVTGPLTWRLVAILRMIKRRLARARGGGR